MSKQKKVIVFMVEQLLLVLGVLICNRSGLGIDSFNAFCVGLSKHIHLSVGFVMMLGNSILLFFIWLLYRELIGFATIFVVFFFGMIFDFYQWIFPAQWFTHESLWGSMLILIIGILIMTSGIALYMESNLGFAPYDCIAYIGEKYLHKPPFMWRIISDVTFAILGFIVGGPVLLGTLILASSVGPFIDFFRKLFHRMLLPEVQMTNK